MNIMLVSVTERTRDRSAQSLGEAVRHSSSVCLEADAFRRGGIIGLVIGVAGAWGMTTLFNLPLVVSPLNAGLAIAFSGLVGVVFGAYPAWRAAKLDPIEALRRE
jgi:putative ABC transport system permease protein